MRPRHLVSVVLAATLATFAALALARDSGVLYEADSKLNHIIVEQDGQGVRRLYFEKNGATQSAIKPGHPLDLELPYSRAAMMALTIVPAPKRVLIIGLGGGAMPMFLRTLYPDLEIDVVDIDPEVVKVATRFFGFKEDKKLHAHVADGRAFTETAKPGWDLIFLDAYGKGEIPRHLATAQFLKTVRGKLAENGMAVGNVWEPDSNPLYASMVRTYAQAFGDFCVVNVPASGNRIFFAGRALPATDKLVEATTAFTAAKKLPFELSLYARGGCARDVDETAPLIEDAPASAPPEPVACGPQPAANACDGCRYVRVAFPGASPMEEVLLCSVPPAEPVKPLDCRGTLPRSAVKGCPPGCCRLGASP